MKIECDPQSLVISLTFDEFEDFVSEMRKLREIYGTPSLTDDAAPEPRKDMSLSNEVLAKVLLRIQGQKSAKFLWLLANAPDFTLSDSQFRAASPEVKTLAPYVSHIAKSCKIEGVDFGSILVKSERRGHGGKMLYKYKLNEAVAKLVLKNPRFVDDLPEPSEVAW